MSDSAQRSEQATPRRLEKARKDGDFPAAREFVAAIQFFAFVTLAVSYFPPWIQSLQHGFRIGLRQAFSPSLSPGDLFTLITRLSVAMLKPLAVLGGVLMGITFLVNMAATNMGFSFARLGPKFTNLNPARRLKEMPATNMAHLLQAMVMIPVMFWLTWSLIRDRLPEILRLPLLPIASSAAAAGLLLGNALKKASFVLLALGAVMFIRDRSRYVKRLRMSKQEIRDESKENEGNPQTKARVRRIQRDLRRKNMMREVPLATAIIVNPTHYAVALKYEQGAMTAPQVVAKGKNYLAARIRQRAIENQVPIIENPPLAQALYKSVDIGQEIPPHLYRAVAEILAYIFKLMNNPGAPSK
ncbi:MAG: EscU/YscU/HrcU family type III secretion system export apparatus switch protein [Acidobacteriota bacterium]|nr:EscU/YscU/HrcU family type III secretion system export apparatus switch protein [Acidobacteriota bacterium]